eukprot:992012_1
MEIDSTIAVFVCGTAFLLNILVLKKKKATSIRLLDAAHDLETSPDILKSILESPFADVNCSSSRWASPLHAALSLTANGFHTANPCNVVRVLLQSPDININTADYAGNTPLQLSIGKLICSLDLIDLLLSHPSVDPNCTNNSRETPLMSAARMNFVDKIERFFLNESVSARLSHENILGVLHRAHAGQRETIYRMIVPARPDILNFGVGAYGNKTPMQMAVLSGDAGTVRFLMNFWNDNNNVPGDFLTRTVYDGHSLLHLAVYSGNLEVLALLL